MSIEPLTFKKALASKKGQIWTEGGLDSIFFPLYFLTSQLLSLYVLFSGGGALGVENLVPVSPSLSPLFITEDSGGKKFKVVNSGLPDIKSRYENGRSMQTVALTMAFV